MGLIGKYLDLLPNGPRDVIIQSQEWTLGQYGTKYTPRCLVGQTQGQVTGDYQSESACLNVQHIVEQQYYRNRWSRAGSHMEAHFDELCKRYSISRVVRWIKLRAGRGTPLAASAPDGTQMEAAETR